MKIELIATSTFGLESIVARELTELGYENLHVENGKVIFAGDLSDICKTNLWLRTADRILVNVGQFEALTFEELFEQTKALPWEHWLPENAEFPVDGKSVKSKLFSISDCQAIVKKAIVEKLKTVYKVDWFPENGPKFKIEVALLKDIATLTIDTTGPGLHKRGYRKLVTMAPIKETLAAAMINLSRWKKDRAFIDPMCGSGTIPIEAALIARNIAPGLDRSFVSEDWPIIKAGLWNQARVDAKKKIDFDTKLQIIGSDMDPEAISIARHHAQLAGVEEDIHFQRLSLKEVSTKNKYGYLVCNPPYGERLNERPYVESLYKDFGVLFKKLDTWSFNIITSYQITTYKDFEKLFGKSADKRRKLYNGRLECQFYQFFGTPPPRKSFINKEE